MLRRAQAVTDQAFDDILEFLAVGQTRAARWPGSWSACCGVTAPTASRSSPIVAFGENAAEPHHEPGHRLLEEGDVIKLDFGALWGGYHADMTRTVAFGDPGRRAREDPRRRAGGPAGGHRRRRAPGSPASAVDAAARAVIEDAGYGARLPARARSRRGPGDPRGAAARPRVRSHVLPAGAVVTVEPGDLHPRARRCAHRGHGRGHRRRRPGPGNAHRAI